MRGITTLIVMSGLLAMALLVAIPVFDAIAPIATAMTTSNYDSIIGNIHETGVKWVVVTAIGTFVLWTVFWILREERQEVR